jgi:hypothetical protein
LYKCIACGKQFIGGVRRDANIIWDEYTKGKQTYKQLASKYKCSIKTIQRILDKVTLIPENTFDSVANVIMDTTYFGRGFGVMAFKDSFTNKFLYKQYVKYETVNQYYCGLEKIRNKGISIQAIICDGKKGLLKMTPEIPVQMCQFHQVQIVTKQLTKKPKTPCGIELRAISLTLTKSTKTEFTKSLNDWYYKWESYLNERTKNPIGKGSYYTHKRVRSAYLSLKRNLPYLFTFQEFKELGIPNTTNAIDGVFSDLKNKLRNHNGLSLSRKKKFIDGFFKV